MVNELWIFGWSLDGGLKMLRISWLPIAWAALPLAIADQEFRRKPKLQKK